MWLVAVDGTTLFMKTNVIHGWAIAVQIVPENFAMFIETQKGMLTISATSVIEKHVSHVGQTYNVSNVLKLKLNTWFIYSFTFSETFIGKNNKTESHRRNGQWTSINF